MSVINGQDVEASIVNNAFVSRIVDTSASGKLSLLNAGSSIINDSQKLINKLSVTIGTDENDLNNLNYSSQNVVANGDSHKIAIGKLDANDNILKTKIDNLEALESSHHSQQDSEITALENRATAIESEDSSFSGNKTFVNNVTIGGNLQVNGTTTTINTQDLNVRDSYVTINKGGTDLTAENAGIEIERVTENAAIQFDSTLQSKFKIGLLSSLSEIITSAFVQTLTGLKIFQAGLKTQTIDEAFLDQGVSIEGVTIKDARVDGRLVASDGIKLDSLDTDFGNHKLDQTIHFVESSISHANIQGIGTNSHATIDTHIASQLNPHNVTKAQVGLGNVTNDVQLKAGDNEFSSFPNKGIPVQNDLILIEDSQDLYKKKRTSLDQLLGGGGANFNTFSALGYDEANLMPITTYTLPTQPSSVTSSLLFYNGLVMLPSDFSFNSLDLTLNFAPVQDSSILLFYKEA